MDFIEHYRDEIGITFAFKTNEEDCDSETLGGSTPDTIRSYNHRFTRTHCKATSFAFKYKGAVVRGAMPEVYAGFFDDDHWGESETEDLLPAVQKMCGFPIDMSEVEAA